MSQKKNVAIGIDLGTTYCCMAVYQDGEVKIIPNELGASTTPSCVTKDEEGYVTVGKTAKDQAFLNPQNTIYDVKRLIGLPYDDPNVQKDIQKWTFEVNGEEDNVPKILLNSFPHYPEQISGMILYHLKTQAEEYLQCEVTQAVITVPAYFNDGQRQATKDAGIIANLEVLRILNEPTAAAIAYCHQNQQGEGSSDSSSPTTTTNFIFDLGGGTLDVALLSITDEMGIKMIATGGDTHLGGEDIDYAMVGFCVQYLDEKYGIDFCSELESEDEARIQRAYMNLQRLKIKCEQAKVYLSSCNQVVVSLDAVFSDVDAVIPISRADFDSLNQDLFDRCIQIMDSVLVDASVERDTIDQVILVGGSSRIPKLQEMIREFFGGKTLCKSVNGDEAVAYGAAIQAALLACKDDLENRPGIIRTQDVIPLPIGLQLKKKGTMELCYRIVLPKNTPIPCEADWPCRTFKDGQKGLVVIRQGEDKENVTKNYLLGKFKAASLPRDAPKGTLCQIRMSVNEEGILTVTASYEGVHQTNSLEVHALKHRLSAQELISLIIKQLSRRRED